jgi:hypothetical protein
MHARRASRNTAQLARTQSRAFTSAPLDTRKRTTSTRPFCAAMDSAGQPFCARRHEAGGAEGPSHASETAFGGAMDALQRE